MATLISHNLTVLKSRRLSTSVLPTFRDQPDQRRIQDASSIGGASQDSARQMPGTENTAITFPKDAAGEDFFRHQ